MRLLDRKLCRLCKAGGAASGVPVTSERLRASSDGDGMMSGVLPVFSRLA